MHYSASEKLEIIRLVEQSELGVIRTLRELKINKSTFYKWYNSYLEKGFDGLKRKHSQRTGSWNRINESDRDKIVEIALEKPELSSREVAWYVTDTFSYYVSESSVYRILKQNGLITTPSFRVMSASESFRDKTTRINQMWQTDFTYFKVFGWGWYYLSTFLDDYSRYIVQWDLCSSMKGADVIKGLSAIRGENEASDNNPQKLLSDHGSCYLSQELRTYLKEENIQHVKGRPLHPQTQGKIERYHRSMKNVIKLDNYYSPEQLKAKIQEFVDYYNHKRYHEALDNLTPADVYFGRDKQKQKRRKMIKQKTLKARKKQNQKNPLSLSNTLLF